MNPSAEYEFPVSPGQARLLVLDQLHPGSDNYHVPVAFAVHGEFDLDAFTGALDALVARHESLRTVFRVHGAGYRQVVLAAARADLRVVPAGEAGDDALTAEAARPFDLANGPLLRCAVFALGEDSHRIVLTAHHLICDGWSMQIMLRELTVAYRARRRGQPAGLAALPVQYPDYATWQAAALAEGGYADAIGAWRRLLDGAPALLALPADRPRPAVQSTAGGVCGFVLPARVQQAVAAVAQARRTTPFVVLFAAFNAFLSRICGRTDLVVGIPVAGRDHPDLQGVVGLLTNTLAMRTDVSGDPGFAELVDRVRDRMRATGPHQEAPFSAVVDAVVPDRQLSFDPLVQVVFAFDDETDLGLELPGARVERIGLPAATAKFDFMVYVERFGAELAAAFHYRSDLFDAATVQAWARSFVVLLEHLTSRPAEPVSAADLLGPDDRELIVREWNRTEEAVPDRLVPDLIAERAAQCPAAIAVVCGPDLVTYRELMVRADRIAAALRAAGVGPEVPVGLCLPRSAEMAIAALAVLRAGGAYVPLDPQQPPARLRQLLTGAGAALVLANEQTERQVGALGRPMAVLAGGAADLVVPPPRRPAPATTVLASANTAYILFTSGSTGPPKGVAVEHRALTNLATAVRRQFPVTAGDRVLQYVAFSFDVAVADLFFTWVAGAELHIAGEHERLGDALARRLGESGITYAFLPPAAAMSMPRPPDGLPALRTMAIGGEPCPAELVERWAMSGRRLLDAYGPAEATVYATTALLSAGEPVVIGRPVANTRAYLLDERLRPVPAGVVGEIYLAGAGLARGYVNRPARTAERFVADPFGPPGTRMYRTGDLGRYDTGGVLAYLGRVDTQVKLRGFRVELGEIETALAAHPDVGVAAVALRESAGTPRLVAYVVAAGAEPPGVSTLRAWLAGRLPGYMIPEHIVCLGELPVGNTGKVDRDRLPDPPATRPELERSYVAATTPVERGIAELWAGVLGVDPVGIHDNFFDLGGNSIGLLAVLAGLRDLGHPGLTMVDLFRHGTVAALAGHLDRSGKPGPGRDPGSSRGADRRRRAAVLSTQRGKAARGE
ncbi:amino acid adenylation domain-containing protein [Actinoplanes sp. NPDC026623]|uniref:non-ribosomal peptide synthetase n=1 Tax=Actinoplanes sp. NPDC026623 TaxID=3155610 RepID=UPI0033CDDA9D